MLCYNLCIKSNVNYNYFNDLEILELPLKMEKPLVNILIRYLESYINGQFVSSDRHRAIYDIEWPSLPQRDTSVILPLMPTLNMSINQASTITISTARG